MNEAIAISPDEAETDGAWADPGERGKLEINREVLRKITEYAADRVPGCVRVRRRIAGLGLGEHGSSAKLTGPDRELRIQLDLALHYPTPIPETVASVRERVSAELEAFADCGIRRIDVSVSALVPSGKSARVE